ncbi:pirin family protein [Moritella sp. 24]|uniref:pirin family protein n=1 Tax=Moritella sp. 24 TaxID=2746230 RepID=UPI001BAA633F|nr:pirin family protein [Moritella sp. 24]QUM77070.1 pirin family protein [Moritella sp. 24]
MIKHYPFQQMGKANHGWLKANHHFSFANYYNPRRMGFGTLKVINDDWIAAGGGFPAHPHKNMEIITFIRSGAVTHKDSQGNKGITRAGEVQVMSAGTGITHSEYNLTKGPLTLFQIWIEPNKHNVTPRWDSKFWPESTNENALPLLVSGDPDEQEEALFINQDARIFGGKVKQGTQLTHSITHQAYVLASTGEFEISVNQQVVHMKKGDGAEVTKQKEMVIKALSDAEIIIIDAR